MLTVFLYHKLNTPCFRISITQKYAFSSSPVARRNRPGTSDRRPRTAAAASSPQTKPFLNDLDVALCAVERLGQVVQPGLLLRKNLRRSDEIWMSVFEGRPCKNSVRPPLESVSTLPRPRRPIRRRRRRRRHYHYPPHPTLTPPSSLSTARPHSTTRCSSS